MRGLQPCRPYSGIRDTLRAIRSQQQAGNGFATMVVVYGVPDWAAAPAHGCERDGITARSRPITAQGLEGYKKLVGSLQDLAKTRGRRHQLVEPVERAQRPVLHQPAARAVQGLLEVAGARRLRQARPRHARRAQARPAAGRRRARRPEERAQVRHLDLRVLRRPARRRRLQRRRLRPAPVLQARQRRQRPRRGGQPRGRSSTGARARKGKPIWVTESGVGGPHVGDAALAQGREHPRRLPGPQRVAAPLERRPARGRRLPVHLPRRPGLPGRAGRREAEQGMAGLRPVQGVGRRAQARRPGARAAGRLHGPDARRWAARSTTSARGWPATPRASPPTSSPTTPSALAMFDATVRRAPGRRRDPLPRQCADLRRRSTSAPAPSPRRSRSAASRAATASPCTCRTCPEFVVAVLAAWRLGAIAVPVNPMLKEREVRTLLEDCEPVALVTLEALWDEVAREAVAGTLGAHRRHRGAGATSWRASTPGRRRRIPALGPDDIAFLTYTSGTTGPPKGAMNTHGNVVFSSQTYRDWVGVGDDDVILGVAPLFHITGLIAHIGLSLLTGAPLVLDHRFDAATGARADRAPPGHLHDRRDHRLHRAHGRGRGGASATPRRCARSSAAGRRSRPRPSRPSRGASAPTSTTSTG